MIQGSDPTGKNIRKLYRGGLFVFMNYSSPILHVFLFTFLYDMGLGKTTPKCW
jgi:hypothetical protein